MKKNDKTNIAYFVVNLNSYSGAAAQALLLGKNVSKQHNIYIFNVEKKIIHKDLTLLYENIYKIDLPKSYLKQIQLIYRITEENNIRIFHLHVLNYIVILLGFFLKKRILLKTTMLGTDDFKSKRISRFGIFKLFVIKLIDYNIALTNNIKKINSTFFESDKIKKIHNGVFIPINTDRHKKENHFVFIGLVCPRKNTYKSIEYFAKHYADIENSKLFVIGPNDKKYNIQEFDDEYYNKCLNFVHNNNIKDKVIFMGLLSKDKIFDILKGSKALLFFSQKEGMPNVVIEAMSHNCLPITSEIDGAVYEIFEDQKSGFVVLNFNEVISMGKIDQAIKLELPFKHANEHYNILNIANKYDELYSTLK